MRSFIEPDFLKQCTVRQYTTPIYVINLIWKLGLGLGLESELHYFSIFTKNKENEHLTATDGVTPIFPPENWQPSF